MIITMTLAKSTKGTHVYGCSEPGTAVPSLYVKKEALATPPPQTIKVTIEPAGGGS